MTRFLAFLMNMGLGGIVDRAFDHMERKAESANDAERIRAMTKVEIAREAVRETYIMADYNKSKLSVPWYWVLLSLAIGPMVFWQASVVVYSVFWCADCVYSADWTIAALPDPLAQTYARAMEWLLYIGSGVGALRMMR